MLNEHFYSVNVIFDTLTYINILIINDKTNNNPHTICPIYQQQNHWVLLH